MTATLIRHSRQLFAATALTLGVLPGAFNQSQAATLTVRQDGTGNYTTIQAGVNAMSAGDTCLVGPGTYPERIKFPAGKSGQAGHLTTLKADALQTVDTYGFDTANCNYLHIEGFNISVPTSATTWPDFYGIAIRSSNVEIVSNYLHDITLYGIFGSTINDANELVAGNRMYKVGTGMYVFGTGWLVEGNEIERLIYSSTIGDADYVQFFGSNLVFRSNYWHGSSSAETGPAHVDGFQTYDVSGQFAQHIRIDGNRITGFHDEGFMLQASSYNNSYDFLICNNFISDSVAYGLAINQIQDVKVYNNTVANIPGSYGLGIGLGATGDIRNNIFYNVGVNFADPAGMTGSNNLIYRPGISAASLFPGDLVNLDPKFVNVAGTNFHLQAGSPAIDAGASLPAVPYDMDGVTRPQGAGWDIGAYEFHSGNPVTNAPVVFTAQPQSSTVTAGSSATFGASATGTAPLAFQWLLNGISLANSSRITGASSSNLSISNVQSTDAGSYALVVSNVVGSVTSSVAVLTILNPPGNCLPPRPV